MIPKRMPQLEMRTTKGGIALEESNNTILQ
jgi:hypothetical protein